MQDYTMIDICDAMEQATELPSDIITNILSMVEWIWHITMNITLIEDEICCYPKRQRQFILSFGGRNVYVPRILIRTTAELQFGMSLPVDDGIQLCADRRHLHTIRMGNIHFDMITNKKTLSYNTPIYCRAFGLNFDSITATQHEYLNCVVCAAQRNEIYFFVRTNVPIAEKFDHRIF